MRIIKSGTTFNTTTQMSAKKLYLNLSVRDGMTWPRFERVKYKLRVGPGIKHLRYSGVNWFNIL